jgi:multicomponent Na+:H+ antiporter subunit B
VFLRAPDVGLTEAAVGAGVTTVLFLLTITKTVRPPTDRIVESIDWTAVAVALVLVGVLASTLGALPPVGSAETPVATSEVTDYYLENAYEEAGVKNAVTAVLASYRGFDTLGEAVVVFAAGIGLLVVLGKEEFA